MSSMGAAVSPAVSPDHLIITFCVSIFILYFLSPLVTPVESAPEVLLDIGVTHISLKPFSQSLLILKGSTE